VEERDDVVSARAVDELARVDVAHKELVTALVGAVRDGDVFVGQRREAIAARAYR
jgi:hypothetical protein